MLERLEKLEQKKQQINAQIMQIRATKRNKENKQEARRIILVGKYYLNKAKQDGATDELYAVMLNNIERDTDRKLFAMPENDLEHS